MPFHFLVTYFWILQHYTQTAIGRKFQVESRIAGICSGLKFLWHRVFWACVCIDSSLITQIMSSALITIQFVFCPDRLLSPVTWLSSLGPWHPCYARTPNRASGRSHYQVGSSIPVTPNEGLLIDRDGDSLVEKACSVSSVQDRSSSHLREASCSTPQPPRTSQALAALL